MATVEINQQHIKSLRALVEDDYLFRQLRHDQQLALTGITGQLPVLEDGIYIYAASFNDSHFLYFVKNGKYASEFLHVKSGPDVPESSLSRWTRIADLPT